MPVRRSPLVVAHALAWVGWGAAAALVVQQPVPVSLAFAGAFLAALVAFGMLLPQGRGAWGKPGMALGISTMVVVVAAVATAIEGTFQPAMLVPWLAGAAGGHVRATMRAAAADAQLAPGVRLAPTLLALALGTALVAWSTALGVPAVAVLAVVAALQLAALLLIVRAAAPVATAPPTASARPPVRLLPLLALAVAGATVIVVLRPALSAIGTDDPQPAGPTALLLAIGGLAGPPLARVVDRLGLGRGGALLATLGGAAALIAPIARPGTLDLVAASVLGIALAAAVALAELARRAGVVLGPRVVAVLLLAGAAGAAVAALLLTAVPTPDVVLGASIACLVAGLGAWAPSPRDRVAADAASPLS